MSKIFQIVNGFCHWLTPFQSLDETIGKYPDDCLFVEAPDYVNEQWAYDPTKEGDERFVKPIPPEGWIYDDETGTFIEEAMIPVMLEEAKDSKQNENKSLFAQYLDANPITWTDGKQYGITMEDQTEISLNISQYQLQLAAGVENPTLEWHSCKEGCQPWTLENLSALSLAIITAVYPIFQLMNKYKELIYACEDRAAVNDIVIKYTADRVQWVADGYDIEDYLDPEDISGSDSGTEESADASESTDTATDTGSTDESATDAENESPKVVNAETFTAD